MTEMIQKSVFGKKKWAAFKYLHIFVNCYGKLVKFGSKFSETILISRFQMKQFPSFIIQFCMALKFDIYYQTL